MFRSDSQAFSDVGRVAKNEFGRIRISIWIRTPSLPENPTTGRNIHREHPAPSPIGLCFQLGTLECGSLLLQLPHKKHKKKLEKLDRITLLKNLGIQRYKKSFIINNVRAIFFGIVNMFEGSANCLACSPRSALPEPLFPRDGQHGAWRFAKSVTRNPPRALGTPKMKSSVVIGPKFTISTANRIVISKYLVG